MALTATQRTKVVFELGYAGNVLVNTSVNYNSIIDDRLTHIDSETETLVVALLAELATAKAKYTTAINKGSVNRIGDIELDTDKTVSVITQEYNRIRKQISSLLDIPINGRASNMISVVC